MSINALQDRLTLKRFAPTSSTKVELQTLSWALNDILLTNGKDVTLGFYTDCKAIIGLPGRRSRLEGNNYFSNNNTRLNNYELYREFYQATEDLHCTFIKVSGHQKSTKKNAIDRLFSLVDQAARKALREELKVKK